MSPTFRPRVEPDPDHARPAGPPESLERHLPTVLLVLGAIGLVLGVLAVVFSEAWLGLAAGVVAIALAGIAARVETARRRAQDEIWETRSQTRAARRRLQQVEAELSEESSIAEARAAASVAADLPPGTDTDEWEIDPISGLLRERHLPVLLQQAVASARRKVLPVSVVYWQLDGFDAAPTNARDEGVTALGAVAWRTLRESDAVFRLGETAAVGVLIDTAEPGAVMVAERVRDALRASPVGDTLTVSAGIACYPTHALDAAELVSKAGRALDAARAEGHARDHVAVAPTHD
ncbi:MAG: diguanylate cyclase [Acidimicrobiia bacterium]